MLINYVTKYKESYLLKKIYLKIIIIKTYYQKYINNNFNKLNPIKIFKLHFFL